MQGGYQILSVASASASLDPHLLGLLNRGCLSLQGDRTGVMTRPLRSRLTTASNVDHRQGVPRPLYRPAQRLVSKTRWRPGRTAPSQLSSFTTVTSQRYWKIWSVIKIREFGSESKIVTGGVTPLNGAQGAEEPRDAGTLGACTTAP
jgi:hypothetical protein